MTAEHNFIHAPQVDSPLEINGVFSDTKWRHVASVNNFVPSDSAAPKNILNQQAWLTADDQRLYFAFKTIGQIGDALTPEPPDSDNPWPTGDSVGLHLALENQDDSHVRIIVNSAGQLVTKRSMAAPFKTDRMQLKTATHVDGWYLELSIPWEDLPSLGNHPIKEKLQILIVHHAMRPDNKVVECFSWSDQTVVFSDLSHYPLWRFTKKEFCGWIESLTFDEQQQPVFRWYLHNDSNLEQSATATVDFLRGGIVRDDYPPLSRSATVAAGNIEILELRPQLKITAPVIARLTLTGADGQEIYQYFMPVTYTPQVPMSFTCKNLLPVGYVDIDFSSRFMEHFPVTCQVYNPSGELTGKETIMMQCRHGFARINVDSRIQGDYNLVISSRLPNGELAELQQQLPYQDLPEWWHCDTGLTGKVSAPYLPVKQMERRVEILAGTLGFEHGVLPVSMRVGQTELLAAPMMLQAVINGHNVDLNAAPSDYSVISAAEDQLVIAMNRQASDIKVHSEITIEEDAFVWCKLTVSGTQELNALALEIPFVSDIVRYLYPIDYTWVNYAQTWDGENVWTSPFYPAVTLYNDSCGLACYCESQRNWNVKSNDVFRLERRKNTTVYRINFVDQTTDIKEDLTLEFGFQLTPPKPYDPRERRCHLTHTATYGEENNSHGGVGAVVYPLKNKIPETGTLRLRGKVDFDRSANQRFWSIEDHCGLAVELGWSASSKQIELATFSAEGKRQVLTSGSGGTDGWHEWLLSWNDSALTIYEDGNLISSVSGKQLFLRNIVESELELCFGNRHCSIHTNYYLAEFELSDDSKIILSDSATKATKDFITAGGGEHFGIFAPEKIDGIDAWRLFGTIIEFRRHCGATYTSYHQNWAQHYGDPMPRTADRRSWLKKLVNGYHQENLEFGLYYGGGLGDNAPESKFYHDYWMSTPDSRWIPDFSWKDDWMNYRDHAFSASCLGAREWSDFIAYNYAQTLKDFNLDGVYYDGVLFCGDCNNEAHGCGYRDRNGQLHDTFPIRGMRLQGKRLYNIMSEHRSNGIIFNHYSGNLVPYAGGWSNRLLMGEEYMVHKPGFKVDLSDFRAKFYGRQFGSPVEFLVYLNQPFQFREGLAYCLLHDISYSAFCTEMLSQLTSIWRILDRLEIDKAQWHGYWNNSDMVSVIPEHERIKASLYLWPEQDKILVIVANLADTEQMVTVRLNKSLIGKEFARAMEPEWRHCPEIHDGEFSIEIPSCDVRMIIVE